MASERVSEANTADAPRAADTAPARAEATASPSNGRRQRIILIVVAVLLIGAVGAWFYFAGKESTDDAQIDGHVNPTAARVGGTVIKLNVRDNQQVRAGDILVQIDPKDYEVSLAHARAELASAEADLAAAQANVPITATTSSSDVSRTSASVEQAQASLSAAQHNVEAAKARLASANARQRELEARADKSARDVERFKGLVAKDELSQQQFDAAVADANAARAAADAQKASVAEAETAVAGSQSQIAGARAGVGQAEAQARTAQTAPQQVATAKAREQAAAAKVAQQKAAVTQAELNIQYTTIKAAVDGIVSRRTVEVGQVIQAGQSLLALVPLNDLWVTANYKETQIEDMRPGQRVVIKVDTFGGRTFQGHVDSIAAATGARFSLLPPENATGNFVKVVQRVPVKIVFDQGTDPEHLLRPGLSCVPTVYTNTK
jgi:membrane fusion protein (multidrug efflux system)